MSFSKKLLGLLLFLSSSLSLGQGFSPIITCPGPYACILSSYLGLQFPDGTHQTTAATGGGGSGTVTSVAFTDGSTLPLYTISGSPITSSGTISMTLASQSANKVLAGPTSGAAAQPTFRSIVAGDLPTGNLSDVGTDGISITGGSGAVIGSGTTISQHVADTTHNGYLSSSDWNTFNGKQAAGNYITALTSDVSASGPGSVAATVNSVGGSSASNINAATILANAATNLNTASAICKRDASGNFSAGNITATLIGNASTSSTTSALSSATTTINVSSATAPTSGQILTATSGTAATWQNPAAVNAINQLTGDVTAGPASGSQSVASTVAKIQGTTISGTTGTGNVVFSTAPTLTAETLSNNTNQLTLGTTNTTTLTMAALTGSRTVTFPDANSNTIRPLGSGTSHQWVSYVDSTGLQNTTQPAFTDISGTATNSQLPSTISSKTLDNSNTYTAKSGSFTLQDSTDTTKQAVFGLSNITTANTRTINVPDANSTTIQADTGAANNFLTAVSAQGVISKAQPAFTNLSGNLATAQLPTAQTWPSSGTVQAITPNAHGVMVSGTGATATVIAPDASATKVLKSGGSSADPSWLAYDNANTVSTLVARDGSGNFSAGTITAALTGTASGNTTYTANNHGVVISGSGNTMTVLAPDASTTKVLTSGGTGADPTWSTVPASGSSTPTASTNAQWDANVNMSANNFIPAYTTTAQAGGTTTLTATSTRLQYFTGSAGQTVQLPVTSTLSQGFQFEIINLGTGSITVQSSGGNQIGQRLNAANTREVYTCILTSGTTAASWNTSYGVSVISGGVTGSHVPLFADSSGLSLSDSTYYVNNNPTTGTPLSSSFAVYNGQSLLNMFNMLQVYTTTATAAGTTNLTINSSQLQVFTGTTTQTVKLPSTGASSTGQGLYYEIWNLSTGALTIQTSTAAALLTMSPNTWAKFQVNSTADNTAARWNIFYSNANKTALSQISRLRSAATSLTTATPVNVGNSTTKLTLTAGDWVIYGTCGFTAAATTTVTNLTCAVSKTSATLPATDTTGVPTSGEYTAIQSPAGNILNGDQTVDMRPVQVSLTSSTDFYLVGQGSFGISTLSVYGSMYAVPQ